MRADARRTTLRQDDALRARTSLPLVAMTQSYVIKSLQSNLKFERSRNDRASKGIRKALRHSA